ncbi:hypothetical protein [Stomatobaculum longum]|uniref:POT-type proton-dependent oligopeptide transporter n=1 Tax=Stomatobaculum longum TaxID=796942 RepID=UPI002805AA15|nr:hypothetical protein [Stomatobaculum longum]
MTSIFIDYLYAAAPAGVGLTKVQASQIITLDAALASIFSSVGSFMADRVFGNRRAYRFCTITGPFFYFSLAIPGRGIVGVVLYCCIGYMNSMVAGSSMYSLLGKLYAKGDERRDGAFSYIYVISNIGAAIPSISGTVALLFGYHAAFAFSAAAAIVGSAYYLLVERKVFGTIGEEPDDLMPPAARKRAVYLLFSRHIITITTFANTVSTIAIFLPVVYFIYVITSPKTRPEEKQHILFLLPMFIAYCFTLFIKGDDAPCMTGCAAAISKRNDC